MIVIAKPGTITRRNERSTLTLRCERVVKYVRLHDNVLLVAFIRYVTMIRIVGRVTH